MGSGVYQDGTQAVQWRVEDKTAMSEQTETIKLQHRTRKGGTLNVNGTVYPVGDDGSVDVSPDHAAKMLQGAMWKPFGQWGAMRQELANATPGVRHGARLPRTRAQLEAAAAAGGAAPPETPPEPRVHQPAKHAPPAPEQVAEATGQLPPDATQPESQPEDQANPPAPASQPETAPETPPVKSTAITDQHPGEPPAAQAEEIPVSAAMTKAALLEAAGKAGIQVDANMTKAEILSTIEAASQ